MKTKLIPLIVTILAIPASQAATTFSFDTLRATQNGTVSAGSFSFDSDTGSGTSTGIITYTLTADFDADGVSDMLTFDIIATADTGNININGGGFVGVGNPRIDAGETLTYTADVPTASFIASDGGVFVASFEGFTGGLFQNTDFPDTPTTDVFTANGVGFLTTDFSVTAADALTITSNEPLIFTSGIDFDIAVEAVPVPEPSSTALLGLGALGFLARRRR